MRSRSDDSSRLAEVLRSLAERAGPTISREEIDRLTVEIGANGPTAASARLLEQILSQAPTDFLTGAAWCQLGLIAFDSGSQRDLKLAATYYWRAASLTSPSEQTDLWARIHSGLGMTYSGQARLLLGKSNDEALVCLRRAEQAFRLSLHALASESNPQGDAEVASLHEWTLDSIAKLESL